jgi:hypothetical protein
MDGPGLGRNVHNTDFQSFVLRHAWNVAFYSFFGMFGLALGFLTVIRVFDAKSWGQTTLDWQSVIVISFAAGLAWMALGGVVSLGLRVRAWEAFKLEQFELAHAHLNTKPEPAQPVTKPQTSREVTIKTIRGTAVIVQPRAGAFASWLRDVLNPDTKTMFSKNEAKRREWEDWQYINLVAQLKDIGWLHEQRTFNGSPDLDGQSVEEMRTWLNTPLL